MAHPAAGRAACRSSSAATTSSTEWRSSAPKGYVTPASAKALRQPVLVPEGKESRVGGIHRYAEHEREVTLTPRAVVGDEVRARRVGNEGRDVREQARAGEQLVGQRHGGRVADGHERQARARVARDDAWQQRQVVLHDLVTDRHRGDVDHPEPGLAQQEQQEEQALLHRLVHRARTSAPSGRCSSRARRRPTREGRPAGRTARPRADAAGGRRNAPPARPRRGRRAVPPARGRVLRWSRWRFMGCLPGRRCR